MQRVAQFLLLALILCAEQVVPTIAGESEAECERRFRIQPYDPASLKSAVVELFDSQTDPTIPIGTAYFVSEDAKFLITASHLFTGKGGPLALVGQNPALNQGKKFSIEVLNVAKEGDRDAELLRVSDADFKGPVTAIDISFGIPGETEAPWVICFPGEELGERVLHGNLTRILHKDDLYGVNLKKKAKHSLYEVSHTEFSQGYSGGPLLTAEGLAIATVSEEKDDRIGYYEPLEIDQSLLENFRGLKLPASLQNVDDMLLNGGSEGTLAAAFSDGRIRNVELAVWYYSLLDLLSKLDSQRLRNVHSLICCPIVRLMSDRKLEGFAMGLNSASWLDPSSPYP
jgi:hypothetical protein